MKFRIIASALAWASIAHAMGPPAMIHTKDGSVYYGELVERVETKGDEHVTLLLATGVPKRIALKDVDPSPVSLPVMPREEHAVPTVTVRTLNGSAYHGELIERVAGEHVVLKLETGDVKTIEWADIDTAPPAPVRVAPREAAPVENVRTKNGSLYHGEIIEKVVRDHVTIKLATDEVKTIEWQDIATLDTLPVVREPRPMPPPKDPVLVVTSDTANVVLERRDFHGVFSEVRQVPCQDATPMGTYRITGARVSPTPLFSPGGGETRVHASMSSLTTKRIGVITSVSSAPVLLAGFVLMIVASSVPSWTTTATQFGPVPTKVDNTDLDTATVVVNLSGIAMLIAGLAMTFWARSRVTVNGMTF